MQVDLETLRETLYYMKSDVDQILGLEDLAKALQTTLQEVDRAERKLPPPVLSPIDAKFLPRK